MNITYDYYRIFYFVAKYQSFTKAASILLSNEPNIYRSIRNLEHEFDPHFQRDNASGRLFLKKRTRRPRDRHQPDRRHTPLKGDFASSDPGGSHRRSTLCLPLRHTQNA